MFKTFTYLKKKKVKQSKIYFHPLKLSEGVSMLNGLKEHKSVYNYNVQTV
ncbi:hypothetical protein CNEO_1260021 [Clostridium neonatale]|nr:hypothetical protein CNEO_1260021 [Clostridium neonatale]